MLSDASGQDWIVYHAVDTRHPEVADTTDYTKRVAMLDRLEWVSGWPVVRGPPARRTTCSAGPAAQPGQRDPAPSRCHCRPSSGQRDHGALRRLPGLGDRARWTWVRPPGASTISDGARHTALGDAGRGHPSAGPAARLRAHGTRAPRRLRGRGEAADDRAGTGRLVRLHAGRRARLRRRRSLREAHRDLDVPDPADGVRPRGHGAADRLSDLRQRCRRARRSDWTWLRIAARGRGSPRVHGLDQRRRSPLADGRHLGGGSRTRSADRAGLDGWCRLHHGRRLRARQQAVHPVSR